jgi:hypothetical protein
MYTLSLSHLAIS